MANESDGFPEFSDFPELPEEFREFFEKLTSQGGQIDPAELAGAAGFNLDPAALQGLISQIRAAAMNPGTVDWSAAEKHALAGVEGTSSPITEDYSDVFTIADSWLSEQTSFTPVGHKAKTITRADWVRLSMPIWLELAKPVANSVVDALSDLLTEQLGTEIGNIEVVMGPFAQVFSGTNPGQILKSMTATMYAIQLGHSVAGLASEVISGGDIGIPLMSEAALLPQNIEKFGEGLDIDATDIKHFVALRELSFARLFNQIRWLGPEINSIIHSFANGFSIDIDAIRETASEIDPSDPHSIRLALSSGALMPQRSEAQETALARLEHLLALIEGWVDHVTNSAAVRLEKASAISEAVRRRRAAGGPAEKAFAQLVGLELRPKKLREASALWKYIGEQLGPEARDALWQHPESVPTAEDLESPEAFLKKLHTPRATDDMDLELQKLLSQETDEGGDTSAKEETE